MKTIPIPQVQHTAHSAPASASHSPINPYDSLRRVADALRKEVSQTSELTKTLEDQQRQSDSLIPGLINSLSNSRALNHTVVDHILGQRQRIIELETRCADLEHRLTELELRNTGAGAGPDPSSSSRSQGRIPDNVQRAQRGADGQAPSTDIAREAS